MIGTQTIGVRSTNWSWSALSGDGRTVAVVAPAEGIRIYNQVHRRVEETNGKGEKREHVEDVLSPRLDWQIPIERPSRIHFGHNRNSLFSWRWNAAYPLTQWDAETGREVHQAAGQQITALAIHPDDRTIAIATPIGAVAD